MYFTKNSTTQSIGYCHATCLKVSVNERGHRIVTWELMYPRYIHAELMTHRAFSRNASSSRATPIKVTLNEVRNTPIFFNHTGLNQSGMVADQALSPNRAAEFYDDWRDLANIVADRVERMHERYGIHKQVLNRALEPFLPIRTIVTTTDIENFFTLRLARDAQPEMRDLAKCMFESMNRATVYRSSMHLPYDDLIYPTRKLKDTISERLNRNVAACARICVGKQSGRESTLAEDIALVRRCIDRPDKHLTPLEHNCFASQDDGRYANLRGWISLRYKVETGNNPLKLAWEEHDERI